MNEAPGQLKPNNAILHFAQFEQLHFARARHPRTIRRPVMSALTDWSRALIPRISLCSATLMATATPSCATWPRASPRVCERSFPAASDSPPALDLVSWMKKHAAPPIANYVNWHGRTVSQIREEAALRDALVRHIQAHAAAFTESAGATGAGKIAAIRQRGASRRASHSFSGSAHPARLAAAEFCSI